MHKEIKAHHHTILFPDSCYNPWPKSIIITIPALKKVTCPIVAHQGEANTLLL